MGCLRQAIFVVEIEVAYSRCFSNFYRVHQLMGRVLKAYREKRSNEQENGSQTSGQDASDRNAEPGVRVAEDFSARVRRIRRCLHPFLIDYLKETQDAYIRFDKLVVNGTVYSYDEETKSLVTE